MPLVTTVSIDQLNTLFIFLRQALQHYVVGDSSDPCDAQLLLCSCVPSSRYQKAGFIILPAGVLFLADKYGDGRLTKCVWMYYDLFISGNKHGQEQVEELCREVAIEIDASEVTRSIIECLNS